MRKAGAPVFLLVFLVIFFSLSLFAGELVENVRADTQPTPGPNRSTTITVDGTEYHWWLVYWSDNTIVCTLNIDHEGKPSTTDVLNICGETIYNKWLHSPACTGSETGSDLQACKGMYLHNTGEKAVTREVEVDLAPAVIWVDFTDCTFDPVLKTCEGIPALHFTGEESLPNETITKIQGKINGIPFSCEGSDCVVPLEPTSEQGVPFSFWGDSSYGDSTILYEGLVRVVPIQQSTPQYETDIPVASYYVDILSSQWKTGQSATCAEIWQVFPAIGTPPAWLDTPQDSTGLNSSVPYYYLAAMLIKNGIVDASSCADYGLESNLSANQCGLEIAQPAVTAWQNQFDDQIFKASQDTGIPGQLLKNLFGQESQLWPGIYRNVREAGFGQLTENGADTALLWNRNFYDQFCPLVLSKETCSTGFAMLNDTQQSLLRGALVKKVNASCTNCQTGIDMTQANFSIGVFAETLVGNCSQVDRLLYNVTHKTTSLVANYNDLWRFTLINYNLGPGCLFEAVSRTSKANAPLDWLHVAANLAPECRSAIDYVYQVSDGDSEQIIAFSTPLPTATRTPIRSATPTRTVTLTRTPTLTKTATQTQTASITPTPTLTQTASITPSPTSSETPSPTPTHTETVTPNP